LKNITSINSKRFSLKNSKPYDSFIWLGKNFIQLAVTNTEHSKVEVVKTFEKENGQINKTEAISVFNDSLVSKASRCFIGIESAEFTLIPNALFDEKNKEDYLKTIYTIDADKKVRAQKVIPIKATSVFSIKTGTETLLTSSLNKSTILHAPSALLVAYQQLIPPNKRYISFVRLQENEMLLSIFDTKKLLLHTTFTIESFDDSLYYYLNALNQLGIDRNKMSANLLGNHKDLEILLEKLLSNIESCKLINRLPTLQYDDAVFSQPTHHFFNLFSLMLCA